MHSTSSQLVGDGSIKASARDRVLVKIQEDMKMGIDRKLRKPLFSYVRDASELAEIKKTADNAMIQLQVRYRFWVYQNVVLNSWKSLLQIVVPKGHGIVSPEQHIAWRRDMSKA